MTSRLAAVAAVILLGCAGSAPQSDPEPRATLSLTRLSDALQEIRRDGALMGELRRSGDERTLHTGASNAHLATLRMREIPLQTGRAYPREIAVEGRLSAGGAAFHQAYTLLAPAAPLWIEGLGLEVESDERGLNHEEHLALRAWLGEQGLPPETAGFEALHFADAGRELRVWHEISGRRVAGSLSRVAELGGPGSDAPLARFDSLFRSENAALKIHHKRPGENGRFTYHRESLELADTLESEGVALVSHQCGCYGYGISSDYMTLGGSMYHVEADWLDDRVAAEFFLGLEWRDGFPWLGFGDRRRMRDLARRVRSYELKDANGELFARVALDLPEDPAWPDLGSVSYRFERAADDGSRIPIARVDRRVGEIQVALFASPGRGESPGWEETLEDIDSLLAAMPTQVVRGDGIRDSHLGEIEELIDWVRLLQDPSAERLADVVSDIDALRATSKVAALLEPQAARFVARAEALPPAPMRLSVAASR